MADSRIAAALAVGDVLAGRSLGEALSRHDGALDARDRSLAAELAYGACRWFPRLDFMARQLLKKDFRRRDQDLRALLLIGMYQLQHTRVPVHAAVGETAGAARRLGKKWAVPLINGVLRGFQRRLPELTQLADTDPSARHDLPDWLLRAMRADWPDSWQRIARALRQRPPMVLRVNRQRCHRDTCLEALRVAGIPAEAHPLVPTAIVLERAVAVTDLPGFSRGLLSVQDAGAQLAASLLPVFPGARVLDACAAPGGKTGHLLEMQPDMHLTAVDVDGLRLRRVAENLERLQLSAELVTADAGKPDGYWARRRYDQILLDAPCSATGVMRRHPDIRLLRKPGDIGALAERQQQMLASLWSLLRPGGSLLYATCSALTRENRMQIRTFLYNHPDARLAPLPALAEGDGFGDLRIAPGFLGMDGFYYALLNKQ